MELNYCSPRDLQDKMDVHMLCATLVETDEVMTMHHDLALFCRQQIRSAVEAMLSRPDRFVIHSHPGVAPSKRADEGAGRADLQG